VTEFFNSPTEKQRRRELRANMPASELLQWSRLKGKQLENCKFRRQFSVGQFVIDFYSPEIKLAIEIDGDSHFEPGAEENDKIRQAFLESAGIRVIHFQNNDIWQDMDWVLEELAREIVGRRHPK
jgi:very-short-patch-repair endonuclease